jgi:hypothetical protein
MVKKTDFTRSEMEKILLADPHIVAIHYDEPWNVPDVDPCLWEKDETKRGQDQAQYLEKFLNMPYIEDIFGTDDRERRKWQASVARANKADIYWAYANCALRYVILSVVNMSLLIMNKIYEGTNSDNLQELGGEVDRLIGGLSYEDAKMPFQERVEYVRNIKNKAFATLKFLSEQNPAN